MIWYGYDALDLGRERDEMFARDKLEENRRFVNLMCSELYIFNNNSASRDGRDHTLLQRL